MFFLGRLGKREGREGRGGGDIVRGLGLGRGGVCWI